MQTGNPAFRNEKLFNRPVDAPRWNELAEKAPAIPGAMTVRGTALKTGILLAICVTSAMLAWSNFSGAMTGQGGGSVFPWLIACTVGCFVISLVLAFKPQAAPFLAPIWSALEGVWLAFLSIVISTQYLKSIEPGLVFQAAGLTFGIAGAAFVAYASGLVRIGGTFKKVMLIAVIGLVVYSLAIVLFNGFLKMNVPNLWVSTSMFGIGFSVLVIILASFFLVLDYQRIEEWAAQGAPKYMEWYGAYALMLTLVWLYVEILNLLAKLNRKN